MDYRGLLRCIIAFKVYGIVQTLDKLLFMMNVLTLYLPFSSFEMHRD